MDSTTNYNLPPPTKTFVVDTSGLDLSLGDIQRIYQFKAWLDQKKAEADEELARKAFRFLDLPAEMRTNVYGYAFINQGLITQDLRDVKVPALAEVSRVVRAESLPLFFENPFQVICFSNFEDRYAYRKRGDPASIFCHATQASGIVKASGVLRIKKAAKNDIRKAGPNALFRNITVKIVEADPTYFNQKNKPATDRYWDHCMMSSIHIKWDRKGASVSVSRGRKYPPPLVFFGKTEVDEAVQAAEDEANRLTGRKDFKGFTLSDLEKIVKKLRYVFPTPSVFGVCT